MATFGIALNVAGCCPPPEPQYAECGCSTAPQIAATPSGAPAQMSSPPRAIPAPVLGRFSQPPPSARRPQPPVKREMITEPPPGLPGPKLDEVPVKRESLATPKPPSPTDTLPDELVMRLLDSGRAAFVRCFKKAIEADPTELSFKVRIHVELDDAGAITTATTDAANKQLDACLVRMTAWLKFPASGKPIAVDLPLFYRGE